MLDALMRSNFYSRFDDLSPGHSELIRCALYDVCHFFREPEGHCSCVAFRLAPCASSNSSFCHVYLLISRFLTYIDAFAIVFAIASRSSVLNIASICGCFRLMMCSSVSSSLILSSNADAGIASW